MEIFIDQQYLREHPNEVFVYGDNLLRIGYGGAAALRDEPNTYGFITKKAPSGNKQDYYKPDEYEPVFYSELDKLIKIIKENPDKTYLISKIGADLANYYGIFEQIIEPKLHILLKNLSNVYFLWDTEKDRIFYSYVDKYNRVNVYEAEDLKEAEETIKFIRTTQKVKISSFPLIKAKNIEQVFDILKIFTKSELFDANDQHTN